MYYLRDVVENVFFFQLEQYNILLFFITHSNGQPFIKHPLWAIVSDMHFTKCVYFIEK